jgi:hypothetical protein
MPTATIRVVPNPDNLTYGDYLFAVQFPDDDIFVVDSVKHGLAAMLARQLCVVDHQDPQKCEWYLKAKNGEYIQCDFAECMDRLDWGGIVKMYSEGDGEGFIKLLLPEQP